MSNAPVLDPTNPLSPSELVLLNGNQFAQKVMMGNMKLMHTDLSVSYSQLGDVPLDRLVKQFHYYTFWSIKLSLYYSTMKTNI